MLVQPHCECCTLLLPMYSQYDKGQVPIIAVSAFTFAKHSKTLSATTQWDQTVCSLLPSLVVLQSLRRPHPKITLNCIPRSFDIASVPRHVQPPLYITHQVVRSSTHIPQPPIEPSICVIECVPFCWPCLPTGWLSRFQQQHLLFVSLLPTSKYVMTMNISFSCKLTLQWWIPGGGGLRGL